MPPVLKLAIALVFVGVIAPVSTVSAETLEKLDVLSRSGESETVAIVLARKQASAGDLLDALATLERAIINRPEQSFEARLYHAALLCRMDDRRGALIEMDGLRGLDLDPALREEARSACSGQGG